MPVAEGEHVAAEEAVVVCHTSLTVRITVVGPFWRWEVLRDDLLLHEGSSITLDAAHRDSSKVVRVLDR